MGPDQAPVELTVLMPCLNEVRTVAVCVRKALDFLKRHGLEGEVLLADNGSTDGSIELARESGARIIQVASRGYGSALLAGIKAARGKFVIMGDADDSYDFSALAPFLERLRDGNTLVVGNRFRGGIAPGAMPWLHQYFGNPVLTAIGRLFFRSKLGDFNCGLRGFERRAILELDLQTTGMEFVSEMIIKAAIMHLPTSEVPTTLSPDGRGRPPHLRTWRDGWRNLRFMLLFSPRWLFLYPGMALMLAGLLVGGWLLPGPRPVGQVTFDVHTLLYAALAVIMGLQAVWFAILTKVFAVGERLMPPDPWISRFRKYFPLELGLLVGGLLVAGGLVGSIAAVYVWSQRNFGVLDPGKMLRMIIPSVSAMVIGGQVILASFFLSVLSLRRSRVDPA
ncbi:MAG: glycosyltransferase family 2 protein [Verrucomicrobia bacterium]|nr:glycosyltransferase family 2 protein [Verrucomicrobiota bacterium]